MNEQQQEPATPQRKQGTAKKHVPLTPAQRILRAQMAAHTLHATHDPHETTKAAIHASQVTRFEKVVDPNHELSDEERARRVEHARSAYMRGLALKRSRSVSERKARLAETGEE